MTTATATGSGTAQYVEPAHSGVTNADFAVWVLQAGGWSVTNNNVNSVLQWMASENGVNTWTGTAGANNPLNNGYGSGGGSGTGSYPDLATAAYDVAANLAAGGHGYEAVVADFQNSADPTQTAYDIIHSGWAGGHYSNNPAVFDGAKWHTAAVDLVNAATSAANGATGPVNAGNNNALGTVIQSSTSAASTAEKAAAATVDWTASLGSFFGDLLNGFGIGWKAVLTIIGGILLIGVGILVVFHRQVGETAQAAALA